MPIRPVSGEIKAQSLNDNFSYLDSQVENISIGPFDTYTSLSQLNAAYPNGRQGFAIVLEADGKTGYMYTWTGTQWKKGGLAQAQGIADGSIEKKYFNDDVSTELNLYAENNIYKCFDLRNGNYFHPMSNLDYYNRYFGSIDDILLIGFDETKEHRLRLITRNHANFKYRFIICSRDSSNQAWSDVFDTTSTFTVTENTSGITTMSATIGNKTVIIKVNFNNFDNGVSINDGLLAANDGRYKIKQSCFYQNTVDYVKEVVEGIDMSTTIPNNYVVAKVNGSSIKVKYQRKDNLNEIIEFDKLGINEIIHPKRVYRESSEKLTTDFVNASLYYTVDTDWISPYANVQALDNPVSSFTGTVGGNHGTNGWSGFPTAKNKSVELYIDGNFVKNNALAFGKVAIVVVKNLVSAPNKINLENGEKAESFEETVVYRVTKNSIEVSVSVKALERLSFGGYVGLQMTTNILQNAQVYFLDTPTKYTPDGTQRNSAPLPYSNDRFVYGNNTDIIVVRTNRDIGIGDLRYKNNAPIHFMSSFNKIYSHLVNEVVVLEEGEELYYAGAYTFMEKFECEGAEAAYFYKESGRTIYCVDFFNAVNETFLKMPEYEIGQVATVIGSENVELIESFVTGNGLKMKSNGLGYIKIILN